MTATTVEEERLRTTGDLTLRASRPLWHHTGEPWPKKLAGASCFILHFEQGLVGVAAEHVIFALEAARLPVANGGAGPPRRAPQVKAKTYRTPSYWQLPGYI